MKVSPWPYLGRKPTQYTHAVPSRNYSRARNKRLLTGVVYYYCYYCYYCCYYWDYYYYNYYYYYYYYYNYYYYYYYYYCYYNNYYYYINYYYYLPLVLHSACSFHGVSLGISVFHNISF